MYNLNVFGASAKLHWANPNGKRINASEASNILHKSQIKHQKKKKKNYTMYDERDYPLELSCLSTSFLEAKLQL